MLFLKCFYLPALLAAEDMTRLDLYQLFKASPFIYTILLVLSLFAFVVWCYSFLTLRDSLMMPQSFIKNIRNLLLKENYDAALVSCETATHFTASILASGLSARKHGHQVIMEAMQKEGKRCGVSLWQRIALLNDVAIIAPMLGLLGTVLGLFYAFYDMNQSQDTLASIFDGLGIAIGTTVAGLIVAITAMIFYATLKFRVVRLLNTLEKETLALWNLIETP